MEKTPQGIITEDLIMNLCKGSADSRYGVIKRAVAQGQLVHIKRGLYILAEKYQRRGSNLFELAQYIYGPSYISFESALSFHACIPESVYIEEDNLHEWDYSLLEELRDVYKNYRVQHFLKGLKKDLRL